MITYIINWYTDGRMVYAQDFDSPSEAITEFLHYDNCILMKDLPTQAERPIVGCKVNGGHDTHENWLKNIVDTIKQSDGFDGDR